MLSAIMAACTGSVKNDNASKSTTLQLKKRTVPAKLFLSGKALLKIQNKLS
jgi:hypothetical protein